MGHNGLVNIGRVRVGDWREWGVTMFTSCDAAILLSCASLAKLADIQL